MLSRSQPDRQLACVIGGAGSGEVGCRSRPVGRLVLRRRRWQRPPRTRATSARRPSVEPTTSGTVLVLLVEATSCVFVGSAVEPESSVVVPSWRRILYDQRKAITERLSQIFQLYHLTSLTTDRKKSKETYVPLTSSCVRVKVCLSALRPSFDQRNC